MSVQDMCEMGGNIDWVSAHNVMGSYSSPTVTPSSPPSGSTCPSVNTLTNTTTSARPLPDPTHCVMQLRALLPSRPDIGFLRTDTPFLLRFLKVRNFQVASAFQLLCGYYSYRQRERDLFKSTIGGPGVRTALSDGVVGVLPERDSSGSAVLVVLASNCDDTKCCLADVWGAVLLSLEHLSARGEEAGVVCVLDWSECPARLNADLSPKALRLVLDGLQDAFPLRLSALHLLNVPWWSGPALRLARPFIKEKTRARMHVHGNNMTSLHRHLPPRLLPAQLGGELGEYRPGAWVEAVLGTAPAYPKTVLTKDCSELLNSTAVKTGTRRLEEEGADWAMEPREVPAGEMQGQEEGGMDGVKEHEDGSTKESEVKGPKKSSNDETNEKQEADDVDEEDEEEEKPRVLKKGFTFEELIKSGAKKFQFAQMTEDSHGFTLKKLKSSCMEYSNNRSSFSPTSNENDSSNSVFSFTKGKSLSFNLNRRNEDDGSGAGEESESVYNFPKPTKSPSILTSLGQNMSRMSLTGRLQEGSAAAYDRGQQSSHLLLTSDATTPT